ncbi:MAG: hypothetical protein MUE50_12230 [Pirellulaceae bacterium]|jgi:hypothetical protein|nr:hypothetical protein [Pirellulaceae bacterium]
MRTTLDIDPTVLSAAKDIAHHSRRSVGAVISDWARQGLAASRAASSILERNGFPLFAVPADAAPITAERVNEILADEDLPA